MSTSTNPSAAAGLLLRSKTVGIATLTLNRPAQYDALSEELLTCLQCELDQVAQDKALRVPIIGAAGKASCAGNDSGGMRASEDRAVHQALFDQCGRMACNMDSHDAREGIDAFIQKREPVWKNR